MMDGGGDYQFSRCFEQSHVTKGFSQSYFYVITSDLKIIGCGSSNCLTVVVVVIIALIHLLSISFLKIHPCRLLRPRPVFRPHPILPDAWQ